MNIELEILITERAKILTDVEAMKTCNASRLASGLSVAYDETHFFHAASELQGVMNAMHELAQRQ